MAIKYAIHVSDIQVRKMARHEEFKKVFDNFFEILNTKINEKNASDFIFVITGDVFHNKIDISNEQQTLIKDFIIKMSDITKVVIVAGNHDFLVNNKQRMDSLTPVIDSINRENVYYLKESNLTTIENLVFVNYSIFEDNKKPENLEEFKNSNKDNDYTYVGLFHAPMIGAVAQNNSVFDKGEDVSVFSGCDLVMAGDIHKYQVVKYDVPVVYAGSMVQQTFGETLSHHGFVIWNIAKRTHNIVEVPNEYTMVKLELNGINNLETSIKITNE